LVIWIYFEGEDRLREGFRIFFGKLLPKIGEREIEFHLVAGESGAETAKKFQTASKQKRRQDVLVLSLRDSEGPRTLDSKNDTREHWMVELMESWFLADSHALEEHFGAGFKPPTTPRNIELIPKPDVYRKLKDASKDCGNPYTDRTKSDHARRLLANIDPRKVRQAAPHCDRLFNTIEKALS
jgi:hypothetical protein